MISICQHHPGVDDPAELIGFTVEARDGQVGVVGDASWDTGADYLVVDSGSWIFAKMILVPTGLVELIDMEQRAVHVALEKAQVKAYPEYDPEHHRYASESHVLRRLRRRTATLGRSRSTTASPIAWLGS